MPNVFVYDVQKENVAVGFANTHHKGRFTFLLKCDVNLEHATT